MTWVPPAAVAVTSMRVSRTEVGSRGTEPAAPRASPRPLPPAQNLMPPPGAAGLYGHAGKAPTRRCTPPTYTPHTQHTTHRIVHTHTHTNHTTHRIVHTHTHTHHTSTLPHTSHNTLYHAYTHTTHVHTTHTSHNTPYRAHTHTSHTAHTHAPHTYTHITQHTASCTHTRTARAHTAQPTAPAGEFFKKNRAVPHSPPGSDQRRSPAGMRAVGRWLVDARPPAAQL